MIIHEMSVTLAYEEFCRDIVTVYNMENKVAPSEDIIKEIYEMMANEMSVYVGERLPDDYQSILAETLASHFGDEDDYEEYGPWYDLFFGLSSNMSELFRLMNTEISGKYKSSYYESITITVSLGKTCTWLVYRADTPLYNSAFINGDINEYNTVVEVSAIHDIFRISFNDFLKKAYDVHKEHLSKTKTTHVFIYLLETIFNRVIKYTDDIELPYEALTVIDNFIATNYLNINNASLLTEYANSNSSTIQIICKDLKNYFSTSITLSAWGELNNKLFIGLYDFNKEK